ncbi:hypothetical protein [Brucella pseudogrignonensis]|uniref:Uncharacterized protein n=1 Tax=Brucella pseudogrignonensis TaxID=419475 RepID=A0ABU1M4L3_9HYPH|nr:hypothetical protein [Brucella pseudogrignonensis]MDR6430969.1 hypothetical protein [Brucella pseudogrignonensis]
MVRLAIIFGTVSLFVVASAAEAALAPNYQRAKELNAVIEAAAQAVPQYPIDKVIYQNDDKYQVIAGPCSLRATIVSKPMKNGMVGPRQFDVKLGQTRCR